ncbi:hypothetical protein D9M72_405440 [compost metagenome]
MAQRLKDADQAVPHHGGAEVPHVHFLRNVWGGIVDDDATGLRLRAALRLGRLGVEKLLDPGAVEREVDEAGAGNFDGGAESVELQRLDDPGGSIAWRQADLLGERHGGVDLDVGELRRPDNRVGVPELFAERLGNSCLDSGDNHLGRIIHKLKIISPRPFRRSLTSCT